VSGCGDASRSGQPGFRVRSDFEAELNSDQGWAGALNENVTVYTDEPFRVRFEVAQAAGPVGRWATPSTSFTR